MLWKLHQYNWFCVYLLFLFSTSSGKRRASLGHRIAWKIGILNSHTVLLLWGTVCVAEKAEAECSQVWGSGAEPAETWQKTRGFIQCWLAEVCWAGAVKILGQVAAGATGLCYTVCLLCNHGSTTACAVLLAGQPFLLLLGNEISNFITFHEDRLTGTRCFCITPLWGKAKKTRRWWLWNEQAWQRTVHFPWNTTAAACRFWPSGAAQSSQLDHTEQGLGVSLLKSFKTLLGIIPSWQLRAGIMPVSVTIQCPCGRTAELMDSLCFVVTVTINSPGKSTGLIKR